MDAAYIVYYLSPRSTPTKLCRGIAMGRTTPFVKKHPHKPAPGHRVSARTRTHLAQEGYDHQQACVYDYKYRMLKNTSRAVRMPPPTFSPCVESDPCILECILSRACFVSLRGIYVCSSSNVRVVHTSRLP